LRIQYKMDNINKNLTDYYKKKPIIIKEDLHLNTKSDLKNYWLAGFIEGVLFFS